MPKAPQHERIHYLTGNSVDEDLVAEVRALVGEPPNGAGHPRRTRPRPKDLGGIPPYADLVPVGGYLVVEDTIVNGHPVWPNFGPGPAEAVKGIVERRDDFASDVSMSKYRLSFNPNGFLKRMS